MEKYDRAPTKTFKVAVDAAKRWHPELIPDLPPFTKHEFIYRPPSPDRAYSFRVWAINTGNFEGQYASIECLAYGKTLPPVNSVSAKRVKTKAGYQAKVSWKYAASKNLKGFRVYENGKVVADEKALGPETRQWSSGPLTRPPVFHQFRVSAVGPKSEVSEQIPYEFASVVVPGN